VEDDAFEEVAEGHVLELGKRLEDLEETPFEADTGLDALNFDGFGGSSHDVPMYHGT
jgi:hypothetical protein